MIIDHVGIAVTDYEKSKKFYMLVLAPLEITLLVEQNGWAGFGRKTKQPEFWFGPSKTIPQFTHIAFKAKTNNAIDEFYKLAIQEGAICKSKPKIRNDYYPNYYSAFIMDYDGNTIGAVLRKIST